MKLRIGDLVTFKAEDDTKTRRGFVTSVAAWYVCDGCVEVTIKRQDLREDVDKKSIIGVVPRRLVRQYWKHI